MKTADMTRRIDAVADNMKTLRIKGTTQIDWNCLTHEERTLFEKVWELKEEYLPNHPPDNVLEENHALFVKGIELIMRRAIDLFQEATKATCITTTKDETFFDLIFSLRIYWFLHEIGRHAEKNRKEEELFEQYKLVEDFEKAWKEYAENIDDKTPLWSPQSFDNFIQPLLKGMLRTHRK